MELDVRNDLSIAYKINKPPFYNELNAQNPKPWCFLGFIHLASLRVELYTSVLFCKLLIQLINSKTLCHITQSELVVSF